MESMLSMASAKMTGLDLGEHHKTSMKSSSSEEMLTTPKLIPESAGILSPKAFSAPKSASSRILHVNGGGHSDDLLTTPVLTTPKTSDLWPSSARDSLPISSFSPENLSVTSPTPMELGPRNPPKDLPMDSDIGLRSPCDGLLAKRRKFKTQQAASSNSVNSDSNSCDTPTSQNSPRDLTMRSIASSQPNAEDSPAGFGGYAQVKLEFGDPKEPKSPSSSIPTTLSSSHNFKHPSSSKPENLRFAIPPSSDLPSHYTPSPLAVPSPNWSAVEAMERNFGQEFLKTPKQLDSNVFDFLTPPPMTPRSRNAFQNRSPGHDSSRYSGRDHQNLSPRLSPRFPIPEAPTDLSSKASSSEKPDHIHKLGDPPPYPEAAEDLSTKSGTNSKSPTPPSSHALPQPSSIPISQVKQEISSSEEIGFRSRTPSGPQNTDSIKTEFDEYEYKNPSQQQPSNFPPFYFTPQFQNLCNPRYEFSTRLQGQVNNRVQNSSSPINFEASNPYNSFSSSSDVSRPHSQPWPPYVQDEDDASMSPPSSVEHRPPSRPTMPTITIKSTQSLTSSPIPPLIETPERKKRGKSASPVNGESSQPKKRNKGKGKASQKDPNGPKRVYTCPHCQRSYDWNYNLNRHLKYECGKENAFQCAKCGRKFPHKQNCVYHLKRKHKIVCETIDQYVTAGLVVFRGSNGPSGQQTANPNPGNAQAESMSN